MQRPTEVERAYEMARSGKYPTVSDIIVTLRTEGYDGHQLKRGAQLRADLRVLIKASRQMPERKQGAP